MKQRKLNVRALLLLFTFLLGTVGVNVNKVYCNHCQETYLHVMVMPGNTPCPCTRDCTCHEPSHHAREQARDDAKPQHAFYKVTGDWAASNFEILFCDMARSRAPMDMLATGERAVVKLSNSLSPYIDLSPPLELLCVYRC